MNTIGFYRCSYKYLYNSPRRSNQNVQDILVKRYVYPDIKYNTVRIMIENMCNLVIRVDINSQNCCIYTYKKWLFESIHNYGYSKIFLSYTSSEVIRYDEFVKGRPMNHTCAHNFHRQNV